MSGYCEYCGCKCGHSVRKDWVDELAEGIAMLINVGLLLGGAYLCFMVVAGVPIFLYFWKVHIAIKAATILAIYCGYKYVKAKL